MFSVVIALTSIHDRYLKQLFRYLSANQPHFSEVILVRDPINGLKALFLRIRIRAIAFFSGLKSPLHILFNTKRLYAGAARNLGWHKAKSEWVVFLDADDDYSEFRFSVLKKYINETPEANVFIHSFCTPEENFSPNLDLGNLPKLVDSETIRLKTSPNLDTESNLNLLVSNSNGDLYKVHHGHLTVKRLLMSKHMFPNLNRAEDTNFCRSVLFETGGVFFIPLNLSRYYPQKSSWRNQTLLTRVKNSSKHRLKLFLYYCKFMGR